MSKIAELAKVSDPFASYPFRLSCPKCDWPPRTNTDCERDGYYLSVHGVRVQEKKPAVVSGRMWCERCSQWCEVP